LAGFYAAPNADYARALADTRELGFAEGRAQGLLEGHAAGHAEGGEEARAALQPDLDALREGCAKHEAQGAVAEALRQVLTARDTDLASLERSVRDIAAATLQTLFPALLSRAAGPEIAALLAGALAERAPEVLTLRAHPDTLAAVATETATAREDGRLTLTADPGWPFGTAELGWTGGGITFDPAALLARVTSVLTASPVSASQSLKASP
jgi:flagellar biosynthesis/type III secretory pathway protein FliH